MKNLVRLMKSLIAFGLLLSSNAMAKDQKFYESLDELLSVKAEQTGFVQKLGYLEYHPDDIYENHYFLENPYNLPALGWKGEITCFLGDAKKLKTTPNVGSSLTNPPHEMKSYVKVQILDKDNIRLSNVIERRYYNKTKIEETPFEVLESGDTIVSRCEK
ncbi:MAG: hypothetical protein CL674_13520 [Bdellovibrionaceae bacterium]|nr:hypothetical protein [Pseudobdellovibrionaceae bacterium]|tara:strand:- start:5051 stop:5530 length:480 start_codon:yes stop_codon:yes gene_type:complete